MTEANHDKLSSGEKALANLNAEIGRLQGHVDTLGVNLIHFEPPIIEPAWEDINLTDVTVATVPYDAQVLQRDIPTALDIHGETSTQDISHKPSPSLESTSSKTPAPHHPTSSAISEQKDLEAPVAPLSHTSLTAQEPHPIAVELVDSTIASSENTPPTLQEQTIIPSNRSLDGRILSILQREQDFIAAIRRGATQNEILDEVYWHLPIKKALSQMLQDAQHLGNLLMLHGYNLEMSHGPDGYHFEEKRRDLKPRNFNTGSKLERNRWSKPQETPIERQSAPTPPSVPERKEPQPIHGGELSPTEAIALNAICNNFIEGPLGAGKWLTAINIEREKIGATPLGIYDLDRVADNITDATGIPIQKLIRNKKTYYYKERPPGSQSKLI